MHFPHQKLGSIRNNTKPIFVICQTIFNRVTKTISKSTILPQIWIKHEANGTKWKCVMSGINKYEWWYYSTNTHTVPRTRGHNISFMTSNSHLLNKVASLNQPSSSKTSTFSALFLDTMFLFSFFSDLFWSFS